MIKQVLSLVAIVLLAALIFAPMLINTPLHTSLTPLANYYATQGADDLGAPNLVTAIVVTYRGLDTLGEVTVLFIATAGIGFLMGKKKKLITPKRPASELLQNGASFLLPIIILFGVYIFMHGHLTPGGGFQGGVVIASGILFMMLINQDWSHNVFLFLESFSGFFYVTIGALGIVLAGGFLDNRILPLGTFGTIFSAGAIPLIYSLIGLKVGTELVGILHAMRGEE
ncbi:MAG: Na(+)/H(+) antiporter subunit B [Candidatus Cloacimonetes bacterium]|nr:Na(+)/H(+) antiporter subunit B [Candidatus Cloacimonadota bacterium]